MWLKRDSDGNVVHDRPRSCRNQIASHSYSCKTGAHTTMLDSSVERTNYCPPYTVGNSTSTTTSFLRLVYSKESPLREFTQKPGVPQQGCNNSWILSAIASNNLCRGEGSFPVW
ncbi:unnamed protein product [Arctogadus glacialis]